MCYALAVAADVALEADVVRLFETMDTQLGLVTALVNNAGIVGQRTTLADMDTARLSRIFSTNITGSFLCAREAVRRMSTKHGGAGGAIVNVSSAASRKKRRKVERKLLGLRRLQEPNIAQSPFVVGNNDLPPAVK